MSSKKKKKLAAVEASKAMKRKWQDPEFRQRMSEAQSERMRKKWKDKKYREAMLERSVSEEFRQKSSDRMKKNMQDPLYVENLKRGREEYLKRKSNEN